MILFWSVLGKVLFAATSGAAPFELLLRSANSRTYAASGSIKDVRTR